MSPAIWWLCGSSTGYNACFAGDIIFIHGCNFAYPAWVYLRSDAFDGYAKVVAIKPGVIAITLPAGQPAGSYDVWVYQHGWIKSPQQLIITTPAALGLGFATKIIAGPPSDGDDQPMLQSMVNSLPNDGTGGEIILMQGVYRLDSGLRLTSGFGGNVSLRGQGPTLTKIEAPNFTQEPQGDGVIAGGQLRDLSIDTTGAITSNKRSLPVARAINCAVVVDPKEAAFWSSGGARVYLTGCDVIGTGVFSNQPASVYIDACNFILDGYTEAAMYLWSTSGVHITNTTARDFVAPGRGRIFALADSNVNIYLENLQTFSLAGTNEDSNCGEQILVEGGANDAVRRMFVYNCKLQGRKDITQGALTAFELWGVTASEVYVDTLTAQDMVWGLSVVGPQLAYYRNIKLINCRNGLRLQGDLRGTILQSVRAEGCIEHSIECMGMTGPRLANCNLMDAPIGIASFQEMGGDLTLVDTTITRGLAPLPGTVGVDSSASAVKITLQNSSVSGFETGNLP